MANSNTASAASDDSLDLVYKRVVSELIEVQRMRLWEARGIIDTVCKAIDHDGEGIEDTNQPFWWSLKAVSELIEDINDKLDQVGST